VAMRPFADSGDETVNRKTLMISGEDLLALIKEDIKQEFTYFW